MEYNEKINEIQEPSAQEEKVNENLTDEIKEETKEETPTEEVKEATPEVENIEENKTIVTEDVKTEDVKTEVNTEEVKEEATVQSEVKTNESKKSSMPAIIGVVIILLIACVGIWFSLVGSDKAKNEGKKESTTTKTVPSTVVAVNDKSNYSESFDGSDLENYVNLVPFAYENASSLGVSIADAYNGTKTTISDINDSILIRYAGTYLDSYVIPDDISFEDENISDISNYSKGVIDTYYSDFIKKYYNTEVTHKTVSIPSGQIQYLKNYYFVVENQGSEPFLKYSKVIDVYEDTGVLMIKEKALFGVIDSNNKINVYKNTLRDTDALITSFEYNGSILEASRDDLATYDDKANTFIHTFIQNSDGSYYWASTTVE